MSSHRIYTGPVEEVDCYHTQARVVLWDRERKGFLRLNFCYRKCNADHEDDQRAGGPLLQAWIKKSGVPQPLLEKRLCWGGGDLIAAFHNLKRPTGKLWRDFL